MPDLEYISPRTNRKYVIAAKDPAYNPTEEDYQQAALKVEQMETGTEQSPLGAMASAVAQGFTTMPGALGREFGVFAGLKTVEEPCKYWETQAREAFPIDPMRRDDSLSKGGVMAGQIIFILIPISIFFRLLKPWYKRNADRRARAFLPFRNGWGTLYAFSKTMLHGKILQAPKQVICFTRSRIAQRQFMRYKVLAENGLISEDELTKQRNRLRPIILMENE